MGKASLRRKQRRQHYLRKLWRKDPEKFEAAWTKRLCSWSQEASLRATRLRDDKGFPAPTAFSLVHRALEELAGCGPEPVNKEHSNTKEIMLNACSQAVANAIDHRLYRLSNNRSNYQCMIEGSHKPPR